MDANGLNELAGEMAADSMQRLRQLAECSEVAGQLTRRYLTPEHRQASEVVTDWMKAAGMTVRTDAVANVVGRYEGTDADRATLMLGSHLDTVRDAGQFDGGLGIVLPILCVQRLAREGRRLPFAIEVIAFGDEEGVRFQSTYLGSRAVAGTFDRTLLTALDDSGTSMAQAMRRFGLNPDRIEDAAREPRELAGYLEVHIEQGPVLESEGLPVGVVTAISGATRLAVSISGEAGHAGTVPMSLRRDALSAASEAILLVEKRCQGSDLVGTVGKIEAEPGAINVIPGLVRFSVDIRSGNDVRRSQAVEEVISGIHEICRRRRLAAQVNTTHSAHSVECDQALSQQLAAAVERSGFPVRRLPSGAGHDTAAMAAIARSAMLFVRCWRGISHHPDESMTEADIAAAAVVLMTFIDDFKA